MQKWQHGEPSPSIRQGMQTTGDTSGHRGSQSARLKEPCMPISVCYVHHCLEAGPQCFLQSSILSMEHCWFLLSSWLHQQCVQLEIATKWGYNQTILFSNTSQVAMVKTSSIHYQTLWEGQCKKLRTISLATHKGSMTHPGGLGLWEAVKHLGQVLRCRWLVV